MDTIFNYVCSFVSHWKYVTTSYGKSPNVTKRFIPLCPAYPLDYRHHTFHAIVQLVLLIVTHKPK